MNPTTANIARIDDWLDALANETDEARKAEAFTAYLTAMSRFWRYSQQNSRMRQISESAVVGGQSVGYPSLFIEAYRGDEHAVPLLPDERDAGVSPDDGARLSSIPLSPLPPHLQ